MGIVRELTDMCQNDGKKHVKNQTLGLGQDSAQDHAFDQFDFLM